MTKYFERKKYTKEEIDLIVIERIQEVIEPICKELGKAIETLQSRIIDLEEASNAMITEMKEWKEKNARTIQ